MLGEMEQQFTALTGGVKIAEITQVVQKIARLALQHPLSEASNILPVGRQAFIAYDFARGADRPSTQLAIQFR